MTAVGVLPDGVTVLERGWLSSNNVVFVDAERAAIVDTGYATHSAQTIGLVNEVLQGRKLDRIVNTHLHSDHCGGNAALREEFSSARIWIPPGDAPLIAEWKVEELSFLQTGQECERFGFDELLQPGSSIELGALAWQVHAAPGHDPHSIMLFEPRSRTLISADALWEKGFGVVFPELAGEPSFEEVAATLDHIDELRSALIIPGHGRVFSDVGAALSVARKRLDFYQAEPERHARHALKVLMKFKLLERSRLDFETLQAWWNGTPYVETIRKKFFESESLDELRDDIVAALVSSNNARVNAGNLVDC
ncbi:Beta-lactamase [Burkholderiales bacterium 8X]|nr:Beta-lactamase [Burkholderiales bacterium 8X]